MIQKIYLTILILSVSSLVVNAQKYFTEYGKIAKDEIDLKEYAPDKDAEAVVLFDIAKSQFVDSNNSFDVQFVRTTRIKILSEAGIKWAEVEIPYYHEGNINEKVYDIEAASYNFENGRLNKTLFDASNIFDDKKNKYWNIKKFAIPNVKVGSVIEFTYKINSQYKFNLRDWEFQWKIPVIYSEYEVSMIPFYEYSWILQGASGFHSRTSNTGGLSRQFGSIQYKDMIHTYVMKDVPAFNNEEFITSINDYIIKLDFQLARINYPNGRTLEISTTWEKMNKELLKNADFGKYINASEKIAPKVLNLDDIKSKTDSEKFNYVLDYVKSNYNWNHYNGKYSSKTAKKFVEEKLGNCADINLFVIGLLNAVGIDAKPVLISTRDNGKISYDYPYAHFFNYVIIWVKVGNDQMLTDATEVLSLNNRIPTRCINDKGLVVQEDEVKWLGLACMFPSEIQTNIQMELKDDELKSSISKTATEYDASYYRRNYTDKLETIKSRLETSSEFIIDSTITVQNQQDKEKPYILTYDETSKAEIINDKIYLSPFLNETISDNPLKQNQRTYPIDMTYPKKRIFTSTIMIPEGYVVDYLPSGKDINNQLFDLKYSVIQDGNKIFISLGYYFKKAVYSPNYYSKVKYYFKEIVNAGNEKIVFAKKL